MSSSRPISYDIVSAASAAAQDDTGLGMSAVSLLVVGIIALLLAAAWRTSRAMRARSLVRAALRSDDPDVRVNAVARAGEVGLSNTARALLKLVRQEQNPAVLRAVTRTVAERQWEPASAASVVELRLWVRAYLDQHPELRGSVEVDAPLLPGVAGAAVVPSLDPVRAARFQRNTDTAHRHEDGLVSHRAATDDPDALGRTRVLVTGAGGPAGISVIQDLRDHGHHVVAVDADPLATGMRLADESHLLPRFDDPAYVAALIRAATVSNVQAVICTVAEEYPALHAGEAYLSEAGIRTLLPSNDAVLTCTDKWQFAQATRGLCVAATGLGSAHDVPGPWVVKPRFGRGSRDVVICRTDHELDEAFATIPEPIVQTLLTGAEFTCDALVGPDGTLVGAVPRWRLATKAGISVKGETFASADVVRVSTEVLAAVGLIGPANVQGFVAEDGTVTVHEVNPRFSGGLPLSLAAGADLVEEYLRAVMGLLIRPQRLVARPGVRMLRYFSEVYETTERFDSPQAPETPAVLVGAQPSA